MQITADLKTKILLNTYVKIMFKLASCAARLAEC